ncbi:MULTISPECIES: NAD-dependent deacylase [Bacillus]|uniref:NAD-dependent protein deacetylase n=1 Tax=Bacillus infantis TaxID=324767 RepID=A0A5D4SHZ8_9BACI|nr:MULTISPECIES: NAD-dependent deacylase [Bacillus]RYI32390.1 NAD-dependent deacylase [Bacillus infantis]TYS62899.1 NAD-dependent deacylase [Bacillus infantis]
MLLEWLKESSYTVILTGAGMSTESGLPDFRSAGSGLTNTVDYGKIASTEALNHHVSEFIEFYRRRVMGLKECSPHAGHYILADWERRGIVQSIITQNVDGFHQAAGSRNVAELHGTLQQVHCQTCGKIFPNDEYIDEHFRCSDCGGILRPSIVLFGEMLPEEAIDFAAAESEKADLFIVLGSSLSVTPANQFPLIAKQCGAKLVIINMDPTDLDLYADEVINGEKAGELLKELDAEIGKM